MVCPHLTDKQVVPPVGIDSLEDLWHLELPALHQKPQSPKEKQGKDAHPQRQTFKKEKDNQSLKSMCLHCYFEVNYMLSSSCLSTKYLLRVPSPAQLNLLLLWKGPL